MKWGGTRAASGRSGASAGTGPGPREELQRRREHGPERNATENIRTHPEHDPKSEVQASGLRTVLRLERGRLHNVVKLLKTHYIRLH